MKLDKENAQRSNFHTKYLSLALVLNVFDVLFVYIMFLPGAI